MPATKCRIVGYIHCMDDDVEYSRSVAPDVGILAVCRGARGLQDRLKWSAGNLHSHVRVGEARTLRAASDGVPRCVVVVRRTATEDPFGRMVSAVFQSQGASRR